MEDDMRDKDAEESWRKMVHCAPPPKWFSCVKRIVQVSHFNFFFLNQGRI